MSTPEYCFSAPPNHKKRITDLDCSPPPPTAQGYAPPKGNVLYWETVLFLTLLGKTHLFVLVRISDPQKTQQPILVPPPPARYRAMLRRKEHATCTGNVFVSTHSALCLGKSTSRAEGFEGMPEPTTARMPAHLSSRSPYVGILMLVCLHVCLSRLKSGRYSDKGNHAICKRFFCRAHMED